MEEDTFRITRLETQKRDEDRISVYLDDAFAFGLEKEVIIRNNLHEGDQITEDEIDEILLVEERTKAKEKALYLLGYRARSIQELKKKLSDKGFSERTIQRVIADFERVGLLDDKQFAASYVRSRMLQRPMGKRLLKQELRYKGITEEISDAVLAEEYGEQSEVEVAKELIRKRLKKPLADDAASRKEKKKLYDFLVRRGFDWELISSALLED